MTNPTTILTPVIELSYAAACVLIAIPMLLRWYTHGHMQWLRLLNDVFVFESPFGLNQARGIGTLAGTFASLSVFIVVTYTAMRGPRGRPALLICAAFFFVYAAGFFGAELIGDGYRLSDIIRWNGLPN